MKLFLLMVMLLALSACNPNSGEAIDSTGAPIPNGKPILVVTESFQSMANMSRYIIVDSETGVEYIVVVTGHGLAITPRIGKTTVKVEAAH